LTQKLNQKVLISQKVLQKPAAPVAEAPKGSCSQQLHSSCPATYASGTPSPAARKILDEKIYSNYSVKGTGKDGRVTKDDAVNATPSMGTPTEAAHLSVQNFQCYDVK
jgi:2-oxoglutarate dehydrogenase E2 component (dihydrolipoamide succinyltransferase)